MKNLRLLLILFLAIGCKRNDLSELYPNEYGLQSYNISLGTEQTNGTTVKAAGETFTSNDLLGIQVYEWQNQTEYIPYAYGLFTYINDNLQIQLNKTKNYSFVYTLIKDGTNIICNDAGKYSYPFVANDGGLKTNNNFIESREIYFTDLSMNKCDMTISGIKNDAIHKPMKRYYGETYVDIQSYFNGEINLFCKRCGFDVKFTIEKPQSEDVIFKIFGRDDFCCDVTIPKGATQSATIEMSSECKYLSLDYKFTDTYVADIAPMDIRVYKSFGNNKYMIGYIKNYQFYRNKLHTILYSLDLNAVISNDIDFEEIEE